MNRKTLTVPIGGKDRLLRMNLAAYRAADINPMRLDTELGGMSAEQAGKLIHAALLEKQPGESLEWIMSECDESTLLHLLTEFGKAYATPGDETADPTKPRTDQG